MKVSKYWPTEKDELIYDKWLKGKKLTKTEKQKLPSVKKKKVYELQSYEEMKKARKFDAKHNYR